MADELYRLASRLSTSPKDLDCRATAAYLVGEDAVCADARTRAHHGFLAGGGASAFGLAFALTDKPSQQAQAGGWLARARRRLDESAQDCVERGFWLCALD